MKNLLVCSVVVLGIVVSPINSLAAPSYFRSDEDRVTSINKITDYFATIGLSESDKKKVKKRRKNQRRSYRLKKKREKSRLDQMKRRYE